MAQGVSSEPASSVEAQPRRSACLRPLGLPRQPSRTWSVAPGIRAQIWQWTDRRAQAGQLRVASVVMRAGRGTVRPVARIPTMTDPATAARSRLPIYRMLAFTAALKAGHVAGALVPNIGAP